MSDDGEIACARIALLPVPGPQDTCSVSDVARHLGTTPQTVRRWCREGRFPGARQTPAGYWRIPHRDL